MADIVLDITTTVGGTQYRGSATLSALGSTAPPPPPPPPVTTKPPAPVTRTPLVVTLTIGTAPITINETDARDVGTFVSDPLFGINQRCLRADVPGQPMTIFFRPETDGSREEVVFEYGHVFATTAPVALPAYSVTITQGATQLAAINVPSQFVFQRWRWESKPRPQITKVADLIAAKLLPPYAQSAGAWPVGPSYAVLGLAGVTAYMPQTGERNDIGMLTEPQAAFVVTGLSTAYDQTIAQAEATGTCPWHMRDENTGAPLDFNKYPSASWYGDSRVANPWVQKDGKCPVTVDDAHMPALAYLPYLLTGDPYYLEALQFQANWNWGTQPPAYRPTVGQSRALAWTLRTLMQATKMTPATVPSWLLPQSYFAALLETHRTFLMTRYVLNPAPVTGVFASTADLADSRGESTTPPQPAGTWIDPWQEEFLACILGWMVNIGFSAWQPVFAWKIGSTLARTSGKSGWPRAFSTPYRLNLRTNNTDPPATTWAGAWTASKAVQGLLLPDQDVWAESSDLTYLVYTRGALVFAVYEGVVGAVDALAWCDTQIAATSWHKPFKWQIR